MRDAIGNYIALGVAPTPHPSRLGTTPQAKCVSARADLAAPHVCGHVPLAQVGRLVDKLVQWVLGRVAA